MSIALIAGLAMLVGAVVEGVALYFLLNMLLVSGAVRKNYREMTYRSVSALAFR